MNICLTNILDTNIVFAENLHDAGRQTRTIDTCDTEQNQLFIAPCLKFISCIHFIIYIFAKLVKIFVNSTNNGKEYRKKVLLC